MVKRGSPFRCSLLCTLILLTLITLSNGVDKSKFKTCAQSGFCNRNRNNASPTPTYNVKSVDREGSNVRAILESVSNPGVELSADIRSYHNGDIIRLTVDELHNPEAPDNARPRFDPASAIPELLTIGTGEEKLVLKAGSDGKGYDLFSALGERLAVLHVDKGLALDVVSAGQPVMSTNSRNLFVFEHMRQKKMITREVEVEENQDEHKEEVDDLLGLENQGDVPLEDVPNEHTEEEIAVQGPKTKEEIENENKQVAKKTEIKTELEKWEENFGGKRDSIPRGFCALN